MADPERRTPSKFRSQPPGGIETRSPGTRFSEEIVSSTPLPRIIETMSVDWTVD